MISEEPMENARRFHYLKLCEHSAKLVLEGTLSARDVGFNLVAAALDLMLRVLPPTEVSNYLRSVASQIEADFDDSNRAAN